MRHARADPPSCRRRFGPRWTLLRRLGPGDAQALCAFFRTHTEDTIRRRYGFLLTEMTPARAAALVGIDQEKDAAFGIFEPPGQGAGLVAVARACLHPDGRSAEIAFVVREDRRRLGMGTALLRALCAEMSRHGVERLVAQVQPDNGPMQGLLRRAGAVGTEMPGADAVRFCLRLPAASSAGPGDRTAARTAARTSA